MKTEQEIRDRITYLKGFKDGAMGRLTQVELTCIDCEIHGLEWVLKGVKNVNNVNNDA